MSNRRFEREWLSDNLTEVAGLAIICAMIAVGGHSCAGPSAEKCAASCAQSQQPMREFKALPTGEVSCVCGEQPR